MKKRVLYSVVLLILAVGLIGCGKSSSKKGFTITCTDEVDNSTGFEIQNITKYEFNEEQYAVGYSLITKQKFTDKDTYDIYKSAQEETAKYTSDMDVKYDLKSDDKNMTLELIVKVENLDILKASEEEKEEFKASNVLKKSEENNGNCKLEGIDRKDLK